MDDASMNEPTLPELPPEVLEDLLALHASGAASPATRALVEAYLARDPALAARMRDALRLPAAALPPEVELRALHRTRRTLALQRWLFALAITFTAIALALEVDFGGGRTLPRVRLLLFEHPRPLGACLT